MQQHIFQGFFGPQKGKIEQQKPEYIIHNEYILEIINNWDFVIELMNTYKKGKLQQIDSMEQLWLTFLTQKNINITEYTNKKEFIQAHWKTP